MLWVRDLDGTKDPEHDAICFYYISTYVRIAGQFCASLTKRSCSGVISDEDQRTLIQLRDRILGPRDLRERDKPTRISHGIYEGGTAYERSIRAKPVKKGGRCYTNANSFQEAPRISSATVGSKRTGEEWENLDIRTEVNHVCCSRCVSQPH